MYYGSSVGYASEWSSIASTRSIKPPSRIMSPVVAKLWAKDASKADVTFKLPDENGGALITGCEELLFIIVGVIFAASLMHLVIVQIQCLCAGSTKGARVF